MPTRLALSSILAAVLAIGALNLAATIGTRAESGACGTTVGWSLLDPPRPPSGIVTKDGLRSIATSPDQSRIVFVGGLRGLYRSDNCGQNWIVVNVPPDPAWGYSPSAAVSEVSIDNSGVIYLGIDYERIKATRDSGQTWVYGMAPLPEDTAYPVLGANSRRIVVTVSGPPAAYALLERHTSRGRRGLWRSDDGGATWHRRRENPVGLLAVAANNPDVVYATTGTSRTLSRSDDAGATFQTMTVTFAPDLAADDWITDLELSVDGVSGWALTESGMIYRSGDGLSTWQLAPEPMPAGKATDLALSHADETILFAITNQGDAWMYRIEARHSDT